MNTTNIHKAGHLAGLALILTTLGCSQESPPQATPPSQQTTIRPPQATVARGAIQFVQGYAKGFSLARSLDRPMLLFFTADWCTYCHQMERDAFVDETVSALAKQFVCVLVDADQEPEVCEKFEVQGYPTIQFMTSRGVPLNRLTGRKPAGQLAGHMEAALEAAAVRAQQTSQTLVR